jgi:hypothetical protein
MGKQYLGFQLFKNDNVGTAMNRRLEELAWTPDTKTFVTV